jgi:hypothetical protein
MPDSVEYIQSDSHHNSRHVLINGFSEGQLGLRIRNFTNWISGEEVFDSPMVKNISNVYIPHFWGPVYAKRLPDWSTWILLLWTFNGVLSAVFLGLAYKSVRKV